MRDNSTLPGSVCLPADFVGLLVQEAQVLTVHRHGLCSRETRTEDIKNDTCYVIVHWFTTVVRCHSIKCHKTDWHPATVQAIRTTQHTVTLMIWSRRAIPLKYNWQIIQAQQHCEKENLLIWQQVELCVICHSTCHQTWAIVRQQKWIRTCMNVATKRRCAH